MNYYTVAGGMGPQPNNSQTLVQEVLGTLSERALNEIASANGKLLVSVPSALKPHTWHLPNGGKSLGNGGWCRRYTIIPGNAPLGTVAHELGHLLFDWPDLAWEKSLGEECLMARGGLRDHGRKPSPPCAPLLLEAGWRTTFTIDSQTRVRQLTHLHLGTLIWNNRTVLVERRDDRPTPHLLIYTYKGKDRLIHPKLWGRLAVRDDDHDQLLLGLIAPILRKIS
ncbi:hypothetical protein KFU94_69235 [Chloroflexi bacterium TSY]|nr:hypothetical protein [Chloroflexi bacterium TSY]